MSRARAELCARIVRNAGPVAAMAVVFVACGVARFLLGVGVGRVGRGGGEA